MAPNDFATQHGVTVESERWARFERLCAKSQLRDRKEERLWNLPAAEDQLGTASGGRREFRGKARPTRVRQLVIAGWTGRDVAALERHIRELETIGVKRPKTTPIFYRVAASLLTTNNAIEVLGEHSSGEVECVAYCLDDCLPIWPPW
jgi:hypothetical protein